MTDRITQNAHATAGGGLEEEPERGQTGDALIDALSGTGSGSDTRAGSLQGGVATGSDDDPDQRSVDRTMANEGSEESKPQSPSDAEPDVFGDTGVSIRKADADEAEVVRENAGGQTGPDALL